MIENRPVVEAVGRLLWPERTRVTELDRKLAATRIEHERAEGRCPDAEVRLARVRQATTQAELDSAVAGRSGSAVPPVLEAAPRVGLAVWCLVTLADLAVYLTLGMVSGQWDEPWVLWPALGGGLLVLGLWSMRERDRRMRLGE
ncbi:hypothetical protein AB0J40_41215 [Amycolatopsis sp. NPDC049691]|uniref:hypothetical protein n=1 Tax=Amycolatopsis sp. NPDC049691 TaxID=3155155 RepID=UPI00341F8757